MDINNIFLFQVFTACRGREALTVLQENHKNPTMISNSSSFTLLPLGHVDSPLFCLLFSVSSFSVGGKLRGSLFSEDTNKDFWTFNVRFYIRGHETAFESRIKAVVRLRYCLLSCRGCAGAGLSRAIMRRLWHQVQSAIESFS